MEQIAQASARLAASASGSPGPRPALPGRPDHPPDAAGALRLRPMATRSWTVKSCISRAILPRSVSSDRINCSVSSRLSRCRAYVSVTSSLTNHYVAATCRSPVRPSAACNSWRCRPIRDREIDFRLVDKSPDNIADNFPRDQRSGVIVVGKEIERIRRACQPAPLVTSAFSAFARHAGWQRCNLPWCDRGRRLRKRTYRGTPARASRSPKTERQCRRCLTRDRPQFEEVRAACFSAPASRIAQTRAG